MIDDLVDSAQGPDVLDVGCGTGISSRLFRDHGCRVLGLRPGGRIGLFWNVAVHDPAVLQTLEAQYRALDIRIDEHSILLRRGAADRFPLAAEGLRATGQFSAIEQREYQWAKRYTAQTWLDQLPTHSDHAALPAEQLDELVQAIDQVIVELGGSVDVAYRTVLVTASRT